MSLLVMSTEPISAIDRLSPSWIRRSISPSKQSVQEAHARQPSASGLQHRSTSGSSNSDDSRSSKSGRRPSVRGMMSRLRSPSIASIASITSINSQDQDLDELPNWFHGFRKYNQLVSTDVSVKQAYPSQDFSKASKALTKSCGGQFIHALPEAVFDFSLLWCPAEKLSRNNSNEPSWSWTAYDGRVNFPFDPTTCPDIYTAPRSDGEWFRSEVVNYHIGPKETPYTVRREKCKSLRMKYPPYFHAPRGSDATIEANTLRFSAPTIPADGFIAEQLVRDEKDIPCSQLLNEKNQHCGVIMDYESSISEPSSTGPFEFVLLSRNLRREHSEKARRPSDSTTHPAGTPIWDGERFMWDEEVVDFDDECFEPGPWKMLNVMLIKWVGDYAERVAIARIHEDAWLQQSPVKHDIVLK